MIQKLPNDIIDIIINAVGKNSIKSIIITKDYNYVKKIAAKRISLWYKIISRSIRLKYYIKHRTNMLFRFGYSCECIYYSPHIPNGLCRFCLRCENKHPFKKRLIDKYYSII